MSRYHRPTAHPKKPKWPADIGLPFPNFALGKTEIPAVCRCIYDGRNFYVTNQLDMHTLHFNGAFGTSSLTFRGPSYDNTSFAHRSYFRKKFASSMTEGLPNGMSSGSPFKYFTTSPAKRIRVDVESSHSGPELCVHISQESKTFPVVGIESVTSNPPGFVATSTCSRHRTSSEMSVDDDVDPNKDSATGATTTATNVNNDFHNNSHTEEDSGSECGSGIPKINTHLLEEEKLLLMPEEAIFLSFGVGCLAIYNVQGQSVDYRQCWKNLVTADPKFPTQYAAYHYYRGKNWVPKSGDNYGASYVLYEGGPQVNHATYVVHVLEPGKPKPTWLELAAWQRLATHLAKQLLLCEVSVPKEFRPENSEPRSVFDMQLNEMSLCRWLPHADSLEVN